jgi:hypothetical protein
MCEVSGKITELTQNPHMNIEIVSLAFRILSLVYKRQPLEFLYFNMLSNLRWYNLRSTYDSQLWLSTGLNHKSIVDDGSCQS